MSLPPPIPPRALPNQPKPNLGQQLAKASWMAPLVGMALNGFAGPQATTREAKLVIGLGSFAIYILGLIFGITALFMIRRFGTSKILVPAIIGVAVNAVIVAAFIAVLVAIFFLR